MQKEECPLTIYVSAKWLDLQMLDFQTKKREAITL